jgi:hypothetical protein
MFEHDRSMAASPVAGLPRTFKRSTERLLKLPDGVLFWDPHLLHMLSLKFVDD